MVLDRCSRLANILRFACRLRFLNFYRKLKKKVFLPNEINIKAVQKDVIAIDIEYRHTTFNENLSYPFSIPSGYTAVEIN
uniref:DUF4292 domain-containing protein n=1 Tax=Flavobacterium sp. TaxID=239 RepID=UPI0040472ECA